MAFFREDDEENQPRQVPQTLIQEGGVDVDGAAVRRGQAHAAEDLRLRAEGFPVHEVAPAAQNLPDEQPEHRQIQHGGDGDLLMAADENDDDDAHDNAAVDGKSPVPDGKDLPRIGQIVVQVEEHIVEPGPDDAAGDDPQHQVKKVVGLDAEVPGIAGAVDHGQNEAKGDNDPVIVYVQAEKAETAGRIEAEVPQHGEADGGIALNGLYKKKNHGFRSSWG